MKMGAQKYVRTRVYPCVPDPIAPLDTAKIVYVRLWGGTQCENAVHLCRAGGVCSWAGRACDVRQMASNPHAAGVGGKCEAVCMGGVVQGKLQHLICPPCPGRRGWHLRAANQQPETCACMSDMSGMSMCIGGMQQTACQSHV